MVGPVGRGIDLVHGLDDEAGGPQEPNPVAVRGMELDPASWPLHAVGLALTAQQPISRDSLLCRYAQRRQVAVGHEDQPPSWPQEPGRLREPTLRVAPRGGSVLAQDEVEPSARQRNPLGVPLNERKGWAELALQALGGGELLAGEIHRDDGSPGPSEPRREVGGAARQLDDVEPLEISQD